MVLKGLRKVVGLVVKKGDHNVEPKIVVRCRKIRMAAGEGVATQGEMVSVVGESCRSEWNKDTVNWMYA